MSTRQAMHLKLSPIVTTCLGAYAFGADSGEVTAGDEFPALKANPFRESPHRHW